jgi:hypothetical protein
VPPTIPLDRMTQQFLLEGDAEAYLADLDDSWNRVARRQPDT